MRLLKLNTNDEITFLEKQFSNDEPRPPYAILSHTWGTEDEEVTFADMKNGYGKSKIGYEKIRLCAIQAKRNNLEYFWVDTCCINKDSFTELSEAIASMFRWYQHAERCYVYLSDVSYDGGAIFGATNRQLESSFTKSRWFTRGWTLQELIAPSSVQFFSREWQQLGTKHDLASSIHAATTIPIDALRDAKALRNFTIAERIRWAFTRTTTKTEDKVYCLQGILGVVLEPIYGEGEGNASHRMKHKIYEKYGDQACGAEGFSILLHNFAPNVIVSRPTASIWANPLAQDHFEQLLSSLKFEQMDSRKATIKSAYSTTCSWLLKKDVFLDWVNPAKFEEHFGLLWIKGKPGVGKSTLVKFVHSEAAKSTQQDEILVSYFFNARGDLLERSTLGLYRSLLFQIFQIFRKVNVLQHLLDVINLNTMRARQFEWTIEKLRELLTSTVREMGTRQLKLVCIIDALDECDELEVADMVQHFEDLGRTSNGYFYVCFASRHYPTVSMRHGVELILENEPGHGDDLAEYVQNHLRVGPGMAFNALRKKVHDKANGVFFWAVLVVDILNREIGQGRMFALDQRVNELPAQLGDLFDEILHRDNQNMNDLLHCIQWILFAVKPLEPREFFYAVMAGSRPYNFRLTDWNNVSMSEADMNKFVLSCSKGLAELTKGRSPKVQFIHESVRDYLIKDGGLRKLWPTLGSNPEVASQCMLRECCERYLTLDLTDHLPPTLPKPSSDAAKRLRKALHRKFPFLGYASQHVFHHANEAAEGYTSQIFVTAFDLRNWVYVSNAIEQYPSRRYPEDVSPLYLFAERNCAQLIREVYKAKLVGSLSSGTRYQCPLSVALAKKHWDAVQALIDPLSTSNTAELMGQLRTRHNTDMTETTKPYVWALLNGHLHLAKMIRFLPYADNHFTDGEILQIAHVANQKGYVEVFSYLEARCIPRGQSMLHFASALGDYNFVKSLLDAGADVNRPGKPYGTALQAVCASPLEHSQQLRMVRLLLDAGANVNATNGRFGGALQAACAAGAEHEGYKASLDVMEELLNAGADVNARGGKYGSPYRAASASRSQTLEDLLWDEGVTEVEDYYQE